MLNLIQHPGVDPESSSGWRVQVQGDVYKLL